MNDEPVPPPSKRYPLMCTMLVPTITAVAMPSSSTTPADPSFVKGDGSFSLPDTGYCERSGSEHDHDNNQTFKGTVHNGEQILLCNLF